MNPEQIPFDLENTPEYRWDNFITSPSNQEAFSCIERWPAWLFPMVILTGPRGCGKTHLAHLWQERSGAGWVSDHLLKSVSEGKRGIPLKSCWIWDQTLRPETQNSLCAFYNQILEQQGFFLILSQETSLKWPVTLPDLDSRLRTIPCVKIHEPDDLLLKTVLHKHFSDLQVRVPEAVISYLLKHMDRSFGSAKILSEKLNRYGLQYHRTITIPLVRKMLETDPSCSVSTSYL